MVIRKTVYESELYEEYINSTKLIVGDYPLVQTCCKEGKIFGFKEPMSVYRLQPTGWTQTVARDSGTLLKAIYQELEYRRIFGGYHEVYTPKAIARHSRGGVSLLAKGKVREAFKIWRLAFKHAPGQMVKANLKFALGMVAKKLFTKG